MTPNGCKEKQFDFGFMMKAEHQVNNSTSDVVDDLSNMNYSRDDYIKE